MASLRLMSFVLFNLSFPCFHFSSPFLSQYSPIKVLPRLHFVYPPLKTPFFIFLRNRNSSLSSLSPRFTFSIPKPTISTCNQFSLTFFYAFSPLKNLPSSYFHAIVTFLYLLHRLVSPLKLHPLPGVTP